MLQNVPKPLYDLKSQRRSNRLLEGAADAKSLVWTTLGSPKMPLQFLGLDREAASSTPRGGLLTACPVLGAEREAASSTPRGVLLTAYPVACILVHPGGVSRGGHFL